MHKTGPTEGTARHDPPAGHGMLVLGLDTMFFYHLPMFMSPHDYQVVLEGTLSQQGSDTYKEDRKAHAQTRVYTLAPVPFVLPELFPPALKRKTIRGDLFRGHFERPPEVPAPPVQIGDGVDVDIVNVVFVQRLLPLPPSLDHLEYILFGKGNELFLAHVITKKGDFDQVLSVDITGHQFIDDDLRQSIRVQIDGKANAASERLAEGKMISASAQVSNKKLAFEVQPRGEIYMSQRDLT